LTSLLRFSVLRVNSSAAFLFSAFLRELGVLSVIFSPLSLRPARV
jgi:hypothetical protein